MDGEIQEGINWDVGVKPRRFFKLVILRPTSELSTHSLDAHVRRLWEIWSALKRGVVPSLGPEYPVDPAGLQVLLGFGHRFFDRADLARPAPEAMIEANRFPQPEAGAGSPILPGSGMLDDQDIQSNDGDQELVVQFLADTPLATHRAQVETWKYLYRNRDMATGELPISIHTFFDGFARENRRSWIDFHDGISNLRKGEERRQVDQTRQCRWARLDPEWNVYGVHETSDQSDTVGTSPGHPTRATSRAHKAVWLSIDRGGPKRVASRRSTLPGSGDRGNHRPGE